MNKDWFDQTLRDKYPAEASDFDTDSAWSALQARRGRKRRRVAFWWFTGAGFVLLGAAVLLWPKAQQQSGSQKTTVPVATAAPIIEEITAPSTAVVVNPSLSSNSPKTAFENKAGQSEPEMVVVVNPSLSSNSPKTAFENKAGRSEPEIVAAQQAIVKNQPLSTNTSLHNSPASDDNTRLTQEPAVGSITEKASHFAPTTTPSESNYSSVVIQPLENKAFVVTSEFSSECPPFATYLFGEKKRSMPKTARWWLGASAYYGLSSVYRHDDIGVYAQNRKSEETALDMIQAGLDLRYHLKPNFFLQTGLYFTQWTDVRERIFQENYTVRDSNYLIGSLIKADGSVQNIYGPVDIVHIHTSTAETYNRYRHIELPLLAGVSLPAGGKWRFECAAGPVFGVLSNHSGTILGLDGNTNMPLQDGPYRNGGTISGMMRLEWVFAGNGWSAGIGVMGRIGLTDWAASEQAYTEKRHAVGAGLVFRKALQ
ncbi:MAG: hypothetical protein ACKVU2_15405 [Saprospiraceae bacterium]